MLRLVAVIGNGDPDPDRDALAESVGAAIADAGFGLVCGGLTGVMEAASRGAHGVFGEDSGRIVAILPGTDPLAANPYADIVLPTGLGYARNLLVALAADAIVAIGGASGTLSEIAHGWQLGKPICALSPAGGWAAELADRAIDDKRADRVFEAKDVDDVRAWLETLSAA